MTLDVDIRWRTGPNLATATFSAGSGVTALIGPSGAGKTSLARVLSGLHTPQEGTITLDGEKIFDVSTNVPAERRGIGLIPQESSLFPHLSVEANLRFACRITEPQLQDYIKLLGLGPLLGRAPHTLSGGEARRAAIVRALAAGPRFLIMDEPTSGLDGPLRRELTRLIRAVNRHAGVPILLITHQLDDMLAAADDAVLMEPMSATLSGPIEQILSESRTAELLGLDDAGSLLSATVTERTGGLITASIGEQALWLADDGEPLGARLRLRVLARDVALSRTRLDGVSILNQLETTITGIGTRGASVDVRLAPLGSDAEIRCRITARSYEAMDLRIGEPVFALIKAVAVKDLAHEAPARP